ncbi:MAG: cysteine dioxygenase family protein [Acetobacteraceae bacterium]|nr:cysteine dioxygenase family protein [Acetobacteraceae bacterium]
MNVLRQGLALETMLGFVAVAARAPIEERPARVAEALGRFVGDPTLLAGRDLPCCPQNYVRHLLATGDGYGVAALAWRPGQMSPVHAHRTWCAFAVQQGTLTEHFFEMGEPPVLKAAVVRRPGDASHGAAGLEAIHRLANCSALPALSIHVYGVPYERFGEQVNLILG